VAGADALAARLSGPRPLVADGGVTTALQALGLPSGAVPETWNIERPQAVLAMHRAFLAAGAEILTTNSFAANGYRHGAGAAPLAAAAVRLARQAGGGALVAGAIGPLGPAADRAALFAAQAASLAGADLLWFETLGGTQDARAATAAARALGRPYALSFDYTRAAADSDSAARLGADLAEACRAEPPPLAVGINCGTGPQAALEILARIGRLPRPILVRANSGVPRLLSKTVTFPFNSSVMGAYATAARTLGARIVGGCCGVDAAGIAAIANAMRSQ
jgi:5-methyltetrahydrofolate--homocysteine methyltransferase